jgi:hypothetical protein
LWPSLEGVAKKLLQLLVALILSKLAMAVALAVAASSAVGVGSGGEVTALPPPEVFAEDPGGSVTQAVGVLLAAVAAFGVSAFSPLLVSRLLPLAEAAVVAQGVRGMPVRGVSQAASLAYYSQVLSGPRLARLAQGGSASAVRRGLPPDGPPPDAGGVRPPVSPGPSSSPEPAGGGAGLRGPGDRQARWRPVPNQQETSVQPGAGRPVPNQPVGGGDGAGIAGTTGPAPARPAGVEGASGAAGGRAARPPGPRAQPDSGTAVGHGPVAVGPAPPMSSSGLPRPRSQQVLGSAGPVGGDLG